MIRLVLIVSLIIAGTSLNAQSLLEANKKKTNKMLEKWSEEYSGLQHLKTLDKREKIIREVKVLTEIINE